MKSAIERYEALASKSADSLPAVTFGPQPSPVHLAAVQMMADLINLADGSNSKEVPHMLRVALSTVKSMQPMLVSQFANVPEAAVVQFLSDLRDRINAVIEEGNTDGGAGAAERSEPGANIAPTS